MVQNCTCYFEKSNYNLQVQRQKGSSIDISSTQIRGSLVPSKWLWNVAYISLTWPDPIPHRGKWSRTWP